MLKKLYYKYLQSLLIFSIAITGIYIVLRLFVPDIVSVNMPYLIVIFVLVTAITHYIITRSDVERMEHKTNPDLNKDEQMKEITAIERRFISRYMLTTTIKLLSFLVLLVLYAYLCRQDAIRFLLNFMAIYLLYSVFEIAYIKKPVVGKEKIKVK
jgi:membrane protein implicated in regulation of membrane protease activity